MARLPDREDGPTVCSGLHRKGIHPWLLEPDWCEAARRSAVLTFSLVLLTKAWLSRSILD
jgi:hypothetical protein